MYFSNDLYPQHSNGNRSVYSESYFNPHAKINIIENKLSGTVGDDGLVIGGVGYIGNGGGGSFGAGSKTYNPSMSVPHTPLGTVRRNRLKLSRTPQFRTSSGDCSAAESNLNQQQQQHHLVDQQEQLYVKVGETNTLSSDVYMNWGKQEQQQQQQHHPNRSIYQPNHRQDTDKDMIYAPSGNRSVISYMSTNNRFDDV